MLYFSVYEPQDAKPLKAAIIYISIKQVKYVANFK